MPQFHYLYYNKEYYCHNIVQFSNIIVEILLLLTFYVVQNGKPHIYHNKGNPNVNHQKGSQQRRVVVSVHQDQQLQLFHRQSSQLQSRIKKQSSQTVPASHLIRNPNHNQKNSPANSPLGELQQMRRPQLEALLPNQKHHHH